MATTYNVTDKIPVGPAQITFNAADVPLFFDNVVLKIEEILKADEYYKNNLSELRKNVEALEIIVAYMGMRKH